MKNTILVTALIFLIPAAGVAQLFQLRSVTSANAWQLQDTVGQSSPHLYGYQSLQISLAKENISFGTYFQGFNDFAGPVKNDPQLRLFNFYLQYRNIADMIDVTLGRQAIFAGVGVGTVDGGKVTARFLDSRVRLVGYGGGLLPARQKAQLIGDMKNNYMAGAQVVVEPVEYVRGSLSFMNKLISQETYQARRSDTLGFAYTTDIRPSAMQEQLVSGEVEVEYQQFADAQVRYDYDTKFKRQSRIEFFTRVKPIEPLGLTFEYFNREPRLFYNSFFSVFTYSTLKDMELGIEYEIRSDLQVFAKYGSLSYGNDKETRVTIGGNARYVSASVARSIGPDNELSAASVNAGYPLLDNTVTPTMMLSYAKYKLSDGAPLDAALSLGVGTVYRPIRVLSVDAQLQWIKNKIYSNDTRFFVRVNYFLSQQLGLF